MNACRALDELKKIDDGTADSPDDHGRSRYVENAILR